MSSLVEISEDLILAQLIRKLCPLYVALLMINNGEKESQPLAKILGTLSKIQSFDEVL